MLRLLQQAVSGAKNGGVGAGLSPTQALDLGLKADVAAVPKAMAALITLGKAEKKDLIAYLNSL
ncbi:MAG: hypothetical protein V7640_2844 [Betaproteobacteria bacterium]